MKNNSEVQMESVPSISDHPCFNRQAINRYGRVHLPVAPRCNIKCNYCNRRFACPNEGRPGVTSRVMDPGEALAYLGEAMTKNPISVAGVAGPGDPLANPESTFRTLALVRSAYPGLLTCLSTNGLAAPAYMDEIIELASHVTITVNAVDDRIGKRIYGRLRAGRNAILVGEAAARLLRERQLEAIGRLKDAGKVVKVNSVMIPGINDRHIVEIARTMAELSVDLFNVMPLFPVAGTAFGDIPEPGPCDINRLRRLAGAHVPQMTHCARCRSDAAGLVAIDSPLKHACSS